MPTMTTPAMPWERSRAFSWLRFRYVSADIGNVFARSGQERVEVRVGQRFAQLLENMRTKGPVTLELRFAEPLIGRAFVWEVLAAARVTIDVVRHLAAVRLGDMPPQGGFDVNKVTIGHVSVNGAVPDVRDGAVQAWPRGFVGTRGFVGEDFDLLLELNGDAEIDADLANRIAEVLEGEAAVVAGVAHQHLAATAQHHFVQSQIVEMSSVGEVDVAPAGIGESEHFGEQRHEGELGAVVTVSLIALVVRIAEPCAQAYVEDAHQESEYRR